MEKLEISDQGVGTYELCTEVELWSIRQSLSFRGTRLLFCHGCHDTPLFRDSRIHKHIVLSKSVGDNRETNSSRFSTADPPERAHMKQSDNATGKHVLAEIILRRRQCLKGANLDAKWWSGGGVGVQGWSGDRVQGWKSEC